MHSARILTSLAAMFAVCGPVLAANAVPAEALRPFEASYAWNWRGMTVAISTLKLEHRDGDTWVYSSKSEPRGLGRLFSERPTQQSIMRMTEDQRVQPLSYDAVAGTSATKRDAHVKFDWAQGRVTGVYEDVPVDLPLKPGVQDDLSVQIAMLVQLQQGKTPENLSMIDKNTIRDYRYRREGEEKITTPIGQIDTVIYSSQHVGSPRVTRFWCAPAYGYLPMRVEQKRIDSVEWSMEIQSFKRD